MKPGIHDLKNSAYHCGEGLSSSGLKELIKSPAHFKHWIENPIEQTPQMALGSLVHAMILEPNKADEEFACGKFNVRRGKEFDACVAANPGKTILSEEQFNEANRIREAFLRERDLNPDLQALTEGMKEKSFFWEDKTTGVQCKVRPDCLTAHGVISDLKTTSDASFDAFQKQMVDLKYFVSGAFYLEGVGEAIAQGNLDIRIPDRFSFVCLETKAPYAIKIYHLDSKAIEIGQTLVRLALSRFAESVATDEWPGYDRTPVTMDLPSWAYWKLNHLTGSK